MQAKRAGPPLAAQDFAGGGQTAIVIVIVMGRIARTTGQTHEWYWNSSHTQRAAEIRNLIRIFYLSTGPNDRCERECEREGERSWYLLLALTC